MSKINLHPQYVRGLIDAEGCFYVYPSKDKVSFRFNNKNIEVLKMLQQFFNEGYIYENCHGTYKNVHEYCLESKNQIKVLLDFFNANGDPIVKQTNRPRNRNTATTYEMWKNAAIKFINKKDKYKKPYSDEIKFKAKKLRVEGLTLGEISAILGPSVPTISNWVNE